MAYGDDNYVYLYQLTSIAKNIMIVVALPPGKVGKTLSDQRNVISTCEARNNIGREPIIRSPIQIKLKPIQKFQITRCIANKLKTLESYLPFKRADVFTPDI